MKELFTMQFYITLLALIGTCRLGKEMLGRLVNYQCFFQIIQNIEQLAIIHDWEDTKLICVCIYLKNVKIGNS